MTGMSHLTPERLDALALPPDATAAGRSALPDMAEAVHLAGCPDCRARLVADDPTAVFALLNGLAAAVPAPERLDPARLPALDRARGPARRTPIGRRAGLALLAAAAGLAALVVTIPPPDADSPRGTEIVQRERGRGYSDVVRHIDSKTAVVMTLLPTDPEGIPVTLIIDEELDL